MSTITRDQIDEKYKWDLKAIYDKEETYKKDIEKLNKCIDEIKTYEKKDLNDSKTLYEITSLIEKANRIIQKMYTYKNLKHDEDISNNELIKDLDYVETLDIKLEQASSFFEVNVLKLKYNDVLRMMEEEPKLKEYINYFKSLFRYKKYTLSKEKEKMLVDLSKAYADNETLFSSLSDSDIDFGKIKDEKGNDIVLNHSTYSLCIKSSVREVRESAFRAYHNVYGSFKNTFTYLLVGHAKKNTTLSKIRGYKSFLFEEMYKDELNTKVLDTLIDTVSNNLEPIYKYYKIKKEILGYDEFHLYDTHASVMPLVDKKYSLDEAKTIIKDVLKVFGEDYVENIERAFTEGWIDYLPNKGKTSGAYSGGCYDTYPYILTNFQGTYNDVSTLIHELGHSMHSYYSRKNNPYVDSNYKIVVAEVASTVNELLLAHYMLDKVKDPKEKLYILDGLLSLYKSTIYRQTMFEEFEKYVYDNVEKDIPLNSDILCDYYLDLNKKYFGNDVVVDEEVKFEWERIPHFYYDFYVYKYATGLSASTYIVSNILSNKDNAVKNYKEFLKTGSRMAPNEELKINGVDLTKKETYLKTIKVFNDLVDLYAKTYEEYKRSGE